MDQVFVIYQSSPIYDYLRTLPSDEAVLYDKSGEISICLIKESIYRSIKSPLISRYKMGRYRSDSRIWFIPLPSGFVLTDSQAYTQTSNKLSSLVAFDIIPQEYRVTVPPYSRGKGVISRYCLVIFGRVDARAIALAKMVVDNSYWYDPQDEERREIYCCYWRT